MTISRSPEARPLLRMALAAIVAVDLLSFFPFIGEARSAALAGGAALPPLIDFLSLPMVRGLVVAAGVAAAVGFGRLPGRLWEGLAALAALSLLSAVHAQLFGSPWRHLFYSGLCLSGWLLGLAVSRARGMPGDESWARTGSLAMLGAAYLNAGISKAVYGGAEWISGIPIQAVVIGQDGLVKDSLLSAYRSWVVLTPAAAQFFAIATVVFELAGPLMLAGGWVRICVALGLLSMHANIYLLTHILYWESMVFLVLFGLSADGAAAHCGEPASASFADRKFAAAAGVLAVCALIAVWHQRSRWLGSQVTAAGDLAPLLELHRWGPFSVGQRLAAGWSVESLRADDDGLVAALSGPTGKAELELTCASSPLRSPFDLGAAHIYYRSDLDFRDLQVVGFRFRELVQGAADGEDVCTRLTEWRRSAASGGAALLDPRTAARPASTM